MKKYPSERLLCTILKFYTLSPERQQEYLGEIPTDYAIYSPGGEMRFFSAHHAFTFISISVCESYIAVSQVNYDSDTLKDFLCLIIIMKDISHQEYFWYVSKDIISVSGPHDRVWRLLKRLSSDALHDVCLSMSDPVISFEELLDYYNFLITKIEEDE